VPRCFRSYSRSITIALVFCLNDAAAQLIFKTLKRPRLEDQNPWPGSPRRNLEGRRGLTGYEARAAVTWTDVARNGLQAK
jgi:hypothetical protein